MGRFALGKKTILASCFLLSGIGLFAQIDARSIEVIPDTFYVGDEAILRMIVNASIDDDDAVRVNFANTVDWGEITNISYRREAQRVLLEIRFVAYRPGTIVFPQLLLDDIIIQGHSTFVSSVLASSGEEIGELKGLVSYPRVGFYIFFLIVFVAFISTGIHFIHRLCRKLSLSAIRVHLKTRSMLKKRFQSTLKWFSQQDQLALFEEITQYIRSVLAEVYHLSLQSATRTELAKSYREYSIDPILHEQFQTLLTQASDSVYAGRRYTDEELRGIRNALCTVQKISNSFYRGKWMQS